jgi:tRNA-2-methylthio-N6-dimethylallyladenosine synthase
MYSPRPGTLSARWEDDVPANVKHARHRAVEELQERVCKARNAGRIGEQTEVLIDSHNKGRWGGRSRGNTLVHVADERPLLGSIVDVRITESSPWYLIGEVVGSPR